MTRLFKNGIETTEFKDTFKGLPCYIVGKGPSLDNVSSISFDPTYPIVCCNEAMVIIRNLLKEKGLSNQTFSAQVDFPTYYFNVPEDIVITHQRSRHGFPNHPNLYVMEIKKWPLILAPIHAVHFAHYLGCTKLLMIGMDAFKGINGYATTIKSFIPYREYTKSTCEVRRIRLVLKELNLPYENII